MATGFILGIVVLSVLALAIVGYYFSVLVKEFVVNEQKKTILEIQKISEAETRKVITPIQLQAYERLVLFLERMKPDNLVLRCYQAGMSTQLLRDVMIKNITDEYEHNLSQQLYISTESWLRIKNAKEEIINVLNALTPKESENVLPLNFAGELFERLSQGNNQIDSAQEFLKKEIQERFK
ncbi:MAG: hypothetical protein II878_05385 [Bacteroidales bacterium]|nr:hypothetical protein [Bacteroidales bacterium]